MLHTITEGLETDAGIVNIVLDNFVLVEPASIAVMEFLGQVPVVEGLRKRSESLTPNTTSHHLGTYEEGGDARSKEFINHVGVELDTLGVHRIIPAAKRDDTRPCNRETVGFDAVLLEKSNIFPPQSVRVGRNIPVLAVARLAGRPGEIVPDRLASAVDIHRSFNLKACCWSKILLIISTSFGEIALGTLTSGKSPDEVSW